MPLLTKVIVSDPLQRVASKLMIVVIPKLFFESGVATWPVEGVLDFVFGVEFALIPPPLL